MSSSQDQAPENPSQNRGPIRHCMKSEIVEPTGILLMMQSQCLRRTPL